MLTLILRLYIIELINEDKILVCIEMKRKEEEEKEGWWGLVVGGGDGVLAVFCLTEIIKEREREREGER